MDFYYTPPNKPCVADGCNTRAGYGFFKDGWGLRKDLCAKHRMPEMVRITNKMISASRNEQRQAQISRIRKEI